MMESKALEAESRISHASTKEEALRNAIAATEIYMKAIKLASNDTDRARLRAQCMKLLARAEEIKQAQSWPLSTPAPSARQKPPQKQLNSPISQRPLSIREQRILLESSRLHGFKFPQWSTAPTAAAFERVEDEPMFSDPVEMRLSEVQEKALAGWQRPREALRKNGGAAPADDTMVIEPIMLASDKIDLVQDVTADCSVVASLCAAVSRAEEGFVKLLSSIIFPYSMEKGCPMISENGKYIFRFHFNGCYRQVIVDDRLPASKTKRTLFVTDRRNPGLIWPALLEKAYLKMRGGYDFPGSNSGTDLWVLTGWIPEQIFLQSDELRPQDLWRRVFKSYGYGDVILTLGTGRLSQREEEGLGLAGEHDYAVLSMKETRGKRMLLVKNPWCDGMVWKESGHVPSETSDQWASELRDALPEVQEPSPGTFWIPFDQVIRNFESMYLNWNPGLFLHRQDHHFNWKIPGANSPGCHSRNPQYSIKCFRDETVWILLSKHFTTEEYHIAKQLADNRTGSSGLGFISLYTFESGGKKIHVSDDALYRGAFVDSPQTLACLDMEAGAHSTIVVAQQDLPLPNYSFTLSVFSRSPLQVEVAEDPYPHQTIVQGAWTARSAGGNASSPSYASNPQFSVSVPTTTDLTLLLEMDRPDLAIHVKMVWAGGERVSHVTARDIVGESGDYRRGVAFVNLKSVAAGRYTVICTTFESGQTGKFTLSVLSMALCQVRPIASEAAGKLSLRAPSLVMQGGCDRMLAPVTVSRLTRMRVVVKHMAAVGRAGTPRSKTPIKTSLEHGQGPNKTVLSASLGGSYSDVLSGARTTETDVTPEMARWGGIWLVVERLPGSNEDETLEVELLSDVPIQVAAWGTGTG